MTRYRKRIRKKNS